MSALKRSVCETKENQQIYNVLNFIAILCCSSQPKAKMKRENESKRCDREQNEKEREIKDSFYELWLDYSKIHQCILDARVPFHFLILARSICYANATWMINYSVWYPIWFICSTLFLLSIHSSLPLCLFSTHTFSPATLLCRAQLFHQKLFRQLIRALVNGAPE